MNDRKKREEQKAHEEVKKGSQARPIQEDKETQRVEKLSKILQDRLITDEEFKILSHTSKEKSD